MKFDQDLCLNLQYDFGKMNSTLGSVVPLAMFVIIIGQEICDFFFYLDLRQLVNLPYLDRDLSFTTSWMILEKKGTLQTRQTPQVQRLLDNSRRLQSDIIGALSLKQQQNLNKTGLTTF